MGPSRPLLLLLLLLPPLPLASSAAAECSSPQDETKECKCEISSDLTLKATGAPASPTAEWKKGTKVITAGDRITLTSSASELSLKITNVADSDAGDYTVSYTVSNTDKVHKFTVQPLVVCTVTETQGSCNVVQGKNVRLKSGKDNSVTWSFSEAPVPAWGTTVNGDLDILNLVKETHEGMYKAKDSTAPTTVHKTITLGITVPRVKQEPKEKNLTKNNTELGQSSYQVQVKASSSGIPKIGAELTLDCLVTEKGAPATGVITFVWLKNGDVMRDHTGATVVFKALMKMDAGTYACKVGTAQSTGYVLTLTGGAVAASYSPALLLTLSLLHALLCLLCY